MMNFSILSNNLPLLMKGLSVTVKLASLTMLFSLILGIVLGSLRYLKIPIISQTVAAFIELTRAIPLIMYIVCIHYTISVPLFYLLHPENTLHIISIEMQSGFIALTLFTSAYIAEIIRSGFNSIEKEQIYGAKALGFTNRQIMQYIFIPIAFYRMLPSILAQFVTLVKDTSLVSAISLIELTRAGELLLLQTGHELEILLFVSFIYFTFCYTLSKLSQYISKQPFLRECM